MADCVFWAFEDHLAALGVPVLASASKLFKTMKGATNPYGIPVITPYKTPYHGRERYTYGDLHYTHGAVSPLIINTLAAFHGLTVVTQHLEYFGPETLMDKSNTTVQWDVASVTGHLFGTEVKVIDLEPAIYLHIDGTIKQHAQFHYKLPSVGHYYIMALQLQLPLGDSNVRQE